MRKNKILLVLCSVFLILFVARVHVNAGNVNNNEIIAEFIGEIKPLNDFMLGDYASSQDFSIEGKMVYGDRTYELSELKISGGRTVYEDGDEVPIYFTDKIDNRIGTMATVSVKVIDFSPQLVSNIEGTEYSFNKMTRMVNGKRVHYSDELGLVMRNGAGKIIQGTTEFDENWNYARSGIDEIKYKFTPYDDRYDVYEGSFTRISKIKPKITTTKNKISIALGNSNNRYTFRINGKDYKKQYIFNLKGNTKYKIEIIQNNPTCSKSSKNAKLIKKTKKPITLFTITVKTK